MTGKQMTEVARWRDAVFPADVCGGGAALPVSGLVTWLPAKMIG